MSTKYPPIMSGPPIVWDGPASPKKAYEFRLRHAQEERVTVLRTPQPLHIARPFVDVVTTAGKGTVFPVKAAIRVPSKLALVRRKTDKMEPVAIGPAWLIPHPAYLVFVAVGKDQVVRWLLGSASWMADLLLACAAYDEHIEGTTFFVARRQGPEWAETWALTDGGDLGDSYVELRDQLPTLEEAFPLYDETVMSAIGYRHLEISERHIHPDTPE